MPKYEIMLILDPKEDVKIADKIATDVFGSDFTGFKKLDRTELAYPINNTTTATYLLAEFETEGANISEFTRKTNISKTIWRQLVINLTEEKANKIPRPRKERAPREFRPRTPRDNRRPAPKKDERAPRA